MAKRHGFQTHPHLGSRSPDALVLIPVHLRFHEVANADKISSVTSVCVGFVNGHVVARMAVLMLNALLRHIPLNIAFGFTAGLAVTGLAFVPQG